MLRHASGHIAAGACSSCTRQLQVPLFHLTSVCSLHGHAKGQAHVMQQCSNTAGIRTPSPSDPHLLTFPTTRGHAARLRPLQSVAQEHASSNPAPLPLTFTGQVMSAASNMVRVELDPLTNPSVASTSDTSSRTNDSTSTSTSSGSESQQAAALPRTQLLCSLRTLLKKLNQTVLVGDRVRVGSVDWNLGKGQVEHVLPRQSELTDPAVANVDFALLVFALNNPPFEEVQVSRFLVSQEASGLPFRLLLNKADLVSQEELDRRVAQVRSWGYDPLVVSCEGDGRGLQSVLRAMEQRTAVVAGPSGAGKSSLINAIRLGRHRPENSKQDSPSSLSASSAYGAPPTQFRVPASALAAAQPQTLSSTVPANNAPFLAVGDLTRRGRGKHTTTTISLIKLPGGGRLADTPGFSQPSLEQVSSTELSSLFPEFAEVIKREGQCQFSNCQHMLEPGCAINSHDPPLERHLHYAKFLLEIKEREDNDIKSMQAGKRAREGNAKVKTVRGGTVRNEVKLDTSKHRRTSRTRAKQHVMDAWNE